MRCLPNGSEFLCLAWDQRVGCGTTFVEADRADTSSHLAEESIVPAPLVSWHPCVTWSVRQPVREVSG